MRAHRHPQGIGLALALATLATLAACRQTVAPTPAGAALPALFSPSHGFRCSPDPRVACSGVFAPRGIKGASRTEAAVLWGGEEAFRARVQSLRAARRSVRVQALIFRGDEAGLLVADLLKQKKKQGLDVRVIVDAMSNLGWQTQWMYFDLKRHGIEVEGYEALYLQWLPSDTRITDPLRPNKRFHDKLWIVDGEDEQHGLAIVGGLNIANEYFRVDPTPINRWHDQDVALRGALVRDALHAFDRNYDYCKRLKAQLPPQVNPDNTWSLAQGTLSKIEGVQTPSWRDETISASMTQILSRPPSLSFVPVEGRLLQSRPRFKETYIEQAYLSLIGQARKQVLIANAYFIPSRPMAEALKTAARRGVRVVILTNSPETNDIASVAVVSRYTYLDLLQAASARGAGGAPAGIEIYEWSGAKFGEGTLHAKYAVVDGEVALVGSFNLDPRSAKLNSETAVALRDRSLASALARHLLEQNLPRAARVTLEQARAYHRPERLAEQFKLLFALPIKDWL